MLTLAGALDAARFAPRLIVLDGRGPLAALVPRGMAVRDLGRARLRSAVGPLLGAVRAEKPDIVVATLGYLNLAILALRPAFPGRPRIFVREANMPERSVAAFALPALGRLAYRMLYPRADGVLCNARAVADALERGFFVPRRLIHLLDNPIDEDGLRGHAAPAVRVPGPGARFVAAGRLMHQKGFDRLIDVMATMPEKCHLTILGDGPERGALEAQIARLNLASRVRLAGFVSEPWAHFAGADAFLLPSRWEGMANAALEALACGTRVIAAPEAGGIAEIFAADGTASSATIVVPWGAEFAAAMRAVAPDPCTTPRASLLPARFSLGRVVRRFESVLDG